MFGKKLPLPAQDAAKPKSFAETIISTTPVLLTVVATLLAGLSSSEMTQAQYYRAMAAQYQSKVGDQWGFFQAKRIRGSGLEQTADLLRPSGQPLGQSLAGLAVRLEKQIRSAQKQTEQIVKVLADGRVTTVDFAPSRQSLQESADALLATLGEKAKATALLQHKITERLQSTECKRILDYLASDAIPQSAAENVEEDPAIQQACHYVRERRSDAEIVAVLHELAKGDLELTIGRAESRVGDFEKQTKPISRGIDDLGKLVTQLCVLARSVQRSVQDFVQTAEQASTDEQDPLARSTARLMRMMAFAGSSADAFQADFKAGRHNFKARCYEHEARQNQSVAELYELQVRVNSVSSERHRQRSKHFFYGMLGAQAGVTIASLALAVRRKSILWSLASATGIGAIFFSGYVYLCM